jgi:hypothetical protein
VSDDFGEHEPVSLERLRKRIRYRKGWKALLRYLRAIERVFGVSIVLEVPGEKVTRYEVTLAAVREHARHLIPQDTRPTTINTDGLNVSNLRELIASQQEEIAIEVVESRAMKRIERLEREVESIKRARH